MNRIALIGIMVEDKAAVPKINEIFSSFGEYIAGRMGLPLADEGVNVISIVMNAPEDIINAASGKLGRLDGVSSKTIYSKRKE